MVHSGIETHCFVLVVVRRADRFLLVQERKYDQRWYLPAGRVEPNETFFQAAARETLEEVPELEEFSYPKPIVVHEEARKRCLETYAVALKK